jgi:hypothetical protein
VKKQQGMKRRSPFSNVATRSLITLLGNVTGQSKKEKRSLRSQSVDESTTNESAIYEVTASEDPTDALKSNHTSTAFVPTPFNTSDATTYIPQTPCETTTNADRYLAYEAEAAAIKSIEVPLQEQEESYPSGASVDGIPLGEGSAAGENGDGSITSVTSCTQAVVGSRIMRECPLCYMRQPIYNFPPLTNCGHLSCRLCLNTYLRVEISENRVAISCPECSEPMHPNDIYAILERHPQLIDRYEAFSVRRVLLRDPDTRWCPAPDCTYAVIASGCAECPQLKCERPGCGTLFCYHCKRQWHANQTCDEARSKSSQFIIRRGSMTQPSPPRRIRSSGATQIMSGDTDNVLKSALLAF